MHGQRRAARVAGTSGTSGRDRRKWRTRGRDKKTQSRFRVIHVADKTWECIGAFLQRDVTAVAEDQGASQRRGRAREVWLLWRGRAGEVLCLLNEG